jgi:hypothetical protein
MDLIQLLNDHNPVINELVNTEDLKMPDRVPKVKIIEP